MRRESSATRIWLLRGLAALALALTFGYLPYHLYARSGLARHLALAADLRGLQGRNTKLRAENDRLAREAEALRSDLRAIERVARAELGWVRPGELVFELVESDRGLGESNGRGGELAIGGAR